VWTKIDDRSNHSAKLNSLSDAALRLWFVVLVDSRTAEKLWLCGRIPSDCLPTIVQHRWRGSRLAKLVEELVRATAGGRSGFGLWEVVEDGWQIHDWEQYGPKKGDDGALTTSDVGRLGGLASAASRRARTGTALPTNAPNRTRTSSVHQFGAPVRSTKVPTGSEPSEPPDPDPDLTKSPLPLARTLELVRRSPEGSEGGRGAGRITAEYIDEALRNREAKCQ
jgi:hypothetical protein